METNKIEFTSPSIDKLIFEVNKNFIVESKDGQVEIDGALQRKELLYLDDGKVVIGIIIELGKKSRSMPFYLKIEMSMEMMLQGDGKDDINTVLERKGTAILVSYARPIIASITAQGGIPQYNLPFMDI